MITRLLLSPAAPARSNPRLDTAQHPSAPGEPTAAPDGLERLRVEFPTVEVAFAHAVGADTGPFAMLPPPGRALHR